MNIKALSEPFPGAISPSLSVEAVFHFFVFYALGFLTHCFAPSSALGAQVLGKIIIHPFIPKPHKFKPEKKFLSNIFF